jgi:hypothetical protein
MIKAPEDPLEAAALKEKIKQQKMRKAREEREASKKDGYISKSVMFKDDQDTNSEDEEFYDSDAVVYDSEEEAEEERLHKIESVKYIMNGKDAGFLKEPEEGYNPAVEVKKNLKFKAATGVKFVEFDEYGMNKAEGLGQFISVDNYIPDYFIEAPPEMLAKAMKPEGVFRDFDKEIKDLDKEGKTTL